MPYDNHVTFPKHVGGILIKKGVDTARWLGANGIAECAQSDRKSAG
jgi:hypothetical protein